jgi:hypothetical protein
MQYHLDDLEAVIKKNEAALDELKRLAARLRKENAESNQQARQSLQDSKQDLQSQTRQQG